MRRWAEALAAAALAGMAACGGRSPEPRYGPVPVAHATGGLVDTIVVGARSPGEVHENERLAHLPLPHELWEDLGSAGLVRSS